MKKLFIAAIAIMFGTAAFADGGKTISNEKDVSYAALNQFKTDFRSADDALWTVTSNCDKVTFTENSIDYTAFYDLNGTYLGLTQKVSAKRMPESVKNEIAKQYKGYEISNVIKYKTQATAEPVVYFVDLKNTSNELVLKVSPDKSIAFFEQIK